MTQALLPRQSLFDTLSRGARAGAEATMAMTMPMAVAERMGLMGEQPPQEVANEALAHAGVHASQPAKRALSAVSHLAFGAMAGSLYSVIEERLRPPGPPVVHGILYGLGVWAISYFGWLPATGSMPTPPKDRAGRRWTMLLAHAVYGASLAKRTRVAQAKELRRA